MTAKAALIALIQALATEPSKVGTIATQTALTITSWRKDHARLVGSRGETIYAIKKIGEYIGLHVTLTEPEADVHATAPESFDPRAILAALHTGAREPEARIDGKTTLTVRNSQLPPDFTRAIPLVFHKAGKARGEQWEVRYE
jgi:hypothetical protein